MYGGSEETEIDKDRGTQRERQKQGASRASRTEKGKIRYR